MDDMMIVPNCSEIVCLLESMNIEQAIAKLKEIGIHVAKIPTNFITEEHDGDTDRDDPASVTREMERFSEWISSTPHLENINDDNDDFSNDRWILVDEDNPNAPDFKEHDWISLKSDGDMPGSYLYLGDHDYSQFPTVYKVEKSFRSDMFGDDGGSTIAYDTWKEEMEERKIAAGKNMEDVRSIPLEVIDDFQDDTGRKKRSLLLAALKGR